MDWSFLDNLGRREPPQVSLSRRAVPNPAEVSFDRIGGVRTTRIEPIRQYDFGVVDKKGRRIGILVYSKATTYKHEEFGESVTHERVFTVTRSGEATNKEMLTRWPTWEEAEADVERHIAASAKRFAKLYRRA